jgi:hypothetical protein
MNQLGRLIVAMRYMVVAQHSSLESSCMNSTCLGQLRVPTQLLKLTTLSCCIPNYELTDRCHGGMAPGAQCLVQHSVLVAPFNLDTGQQLSNYSGIYEMLIEPMEMSLAPATRRQCRWTSLDHFRVSDFLSSSTYPSP